MFACVFEFVHLFVYTCIYIERDACMIYIYIYYSMCIFIYTTTCEYIHTYIYTYICLFMCVCLDVYFLGGGIARVLTI